MERETSDYHSITNFSRYIYIYICVLIVQKITSVSQALETEEDIERCIKLASLLREMGTAYKALKAL